jgi:hypothetical protein
MKKNTYNLLKEPINQIYRDLLDFSIHECKYFLLVTDKKNRQLYPTGKAILDQLSPFLFKLQLKSEWPGTILFQVKVPVYIYHFVPESLEILKKSATSLYEWQRPNLPDDLCLLRSDESPWLVNIAHERDSFLLLSDDEMSCLLEAMPTFNNILEIEK